MPLLTAVHRYLASAARNDEGVTAVEYGLIAALIAVAIILAVTAIGTNLNTLFTSVSGEL